MSLTDPMEGALRNAGADSELARYIAEQWRQEGTPYTWLAFRAYLEQFNMVDFFVQQHTGHPDLSTCMSEYRPPETLRHDARGISDAASADDQEETPAGRPASLNEGRGRSQSPSPKRQFRRPERRLMMKGLRKAGAPEPLPSVVTAKWVQQREPYTWGAFTSFLRRFDLMEFLEGKVGEEAHSQRLSVDDTTLFVPFPKCMAPLEDRLRWKLLIATQKGEDHRDDSSPTARSMETEQSSQGSSESDVPPEDVPPPPPPSTQQEWWPLTGHQTLRTKDTLRMRAQMNTKMGPATQIWPLAQECRVYLIAKGTRPTAGTSNSRRFLAELEFEARTICAAGKANLPEGCSSVDPLIVWRYVQAVKDFVLNPPGGDLECSDSRVTRLAAHYELRIRTKWWNEYRGLSVQDRTSGMHTLTSRIVGYMTFARATWQTVRNLLLLRKEGPIQVLGLDCYLRDRKDFTGPSVKYNSQSPTPGVEFCDDFNRNRQCDPQLCPLLHRCSVLISPDEVCGSAQHSARDHWRARQAWGDRTTPRKPRQSPYVRRTEPTPERRPLHPTERADSKRERSRSPLLLTRDSGRLHRHFTSGQWHVASGQWCRRLPDESRGSRQH